MDYADGRPRMVAAWFGQNVVLRNIRMNAPPPYTSTFGSVYNRTREALTRTTNKRTEAMASAAPLPLNAGCPEDWTR